MNHRVLPVLNAVGCLALTGLVVVQWRRERALDDTIADVRSEWLAAKDQIAAAEERRSALERDIAVLKQAIGETQTAAETATRSAAEKEEQATKLSSELEAARKQITEWENALHARDERIRSLDGELRATRKRLDEAIAKLKAAAPK